MSIKSVQSNSKKMEEGASSASYRTSSGESAAKGKLSSLLSQSLAISLVKVRRECGDETAAQILNILRDEYFDIKRFKKEVTCITKCQEITSMTIKKIEW